MTPIRYRSIVIILTLTAGFQGSPLAEESDFEPQWSPTLHIRRTEGKIRIDGELDDPGWGNASRATNFAETDPGDQVKPPVESEAWVTYDSENLYVALIAYDDPRTIRVSLRDRDNIFQDDYYGLMLDTYGDYIWGYEVFVNPIGIQGDLRVMSDGNEDISFDIIFHSRGRLTETGYQVELAIPFASLRFPDKERQVWRLNFWRDHQREIRRRYSWAAVDRDNACWMCTWGTLTGIEGIRPGSQVDIIPSALVFQTGEIRDPERPGSGFDNHDPEGEISLNVRYGLSSSASIEATLNPDFSQIESDVVQIDVNSPFALTYPERRPFFQEGSDLYETQISAIYTRSINDPSAAGKLTGQFGSTGVLYLAGADEHTPVILPAEEFNGFAEVGRSLSNILRLRHAYGQGSHVGGLATDRRTIGGDLDGSGTVYGIDGRHRLTSTLQVEYQLLGSHTVEPDDSTLVRDVEARDFIFDRKHTLGFDGESFSGRAVYLSLERSGRTWSQDIDYWEYSPAFRADNGFVARNNYRVVSLNENLWFRPNGSLLVSWGPWMGIGKEWNPLTDRWEDQWLRVGASLNFVSQTEIWVNGLLSSERFRGCVFDGIQTLETGFHSRPSETLQVGGEVRFGKLIARGSDPFLGDFFRTGAWGALKLGPRFTLEPEWNYEEMGNPVLGGKDYAGFTFRNRAAYQFSRELFFRLVTQYNGFLGRFDIEPLLTYRLSPFTVFFLGATSGYTRFETTGRDWELTGRQFFAKVQVLVRL